MKGKGFGKGKGKGAEQGRGKKGKGNVILSIVLCIIVISLNDNKPIGPTALSQTDICCVYFSSTCNICSCLYLCRLKMLCSARKSNLMNKSKIHRKPLWCGMSTSEKCVRQGEHQS